jgi:carboxyl-terminal processing protease
MPRQALRPLTLTAILALMAVIVGAQAPAPVPDDQETARSVVELLERKHMAHPVIDDQIAMKWYDNFIKELDPQKYYFLKGDVEEFRKQAKNLNGQIREGNLELARKVFERFLKRHDERFQTALEFLKKKPDFTIDESITDDPETTDYAKDKAEADERWRKRVKLDLLQKKVDGVKDEEAVHKLTVSYRDRNRFFHQFDSSELLEVDLSSLTKIFDPHSAYMSAKNWEDMLNQQLHLSLEGIGASLQSEDGYAVVVEIVPGAAADKDGRLQPGDKILGVRKDNGEEIDFVEKKLSDVVRHIRGDRGTKVKLIVQPEGTKEKKIYELTRERIELKEQHAKGKVIPIKDGAGKELKVGVISLPAFYGDTMALLRGDQNAVSATSDCRRLLDEFKDEKVDCVIVDLRGNGGGLLEEARTLSGLFIDTGPVVQVKQASGVQSLADDDEGTAWDGPLVVLIDKMSASASEIFAGVIKDYNRGLIIGDASTFGKGTVQSIEPVSDHLRRRAGGKNLGALKLTIQQFYRANGESTQIHGVTPHIHIPSVHDHMDFGEGKMDNALKFDKVDALRHDNYHRVPTDLVGILNKKSEERRKDDPKFQKQNDQIKKFLVRKKRHTIPLNESKFRAEFFPEDQEEKIAEEKAKIDKKNKKKFRERDVWISDFYNDEILRIVADYLSLGSKVVAHAPERAQINDAVGQ